MKKLCLVLVCAVGLGAYEPVMLAAQSKQANVGRLKSEYEKFKEALKCFKQKGWKGCDAAQKKRIVAAGTVLAGLVLAAVGGGFALLRWRRGKIMPAEVGGRKPDKKDVLEPDQRNISEELFAALRAGETDKVKKLIEADDSLIDAVGDESGDSLLAVAVRKNNKEVVQLLLEKDVEIPFIIYSNASQEIKDLVNKVQKTMDENIPKLIQAIVNNNIEVVRELAERVGDLREIYDSNHYTLLHKAAEKGHVEIARLLIERGIGVNVVDKKSWAPLTVAVNEGNEEMVKFLVVEKGADIMQGDIDFADDSLKDFLTNKMAEQQQKGQ